jgi:hypothetical protein
MCPLSVRRDARSGATAASQKRKRAGELHEERAGALGVNKRGMEEEVTKYRNLMLLNIEPYMVLNIGTLLILHVATCHYRQQQVAANGNRASRIS